MVGPGSRIILGAASWGNSYGIANSSGMSSQDLALLLSEASSAGVRAIDTAAAYGQSENLIGTVNFSRIPVYTKPRQQGLNPGNLRQRVEESLSRLGEESIEGLTFHSPELLLTNAQDIIPAIDSLVAEGRVNSWGVSVYEPTEALEIAANTSMHYVQAPANIFDQRFLDDEFLRQLENHGIRLQLRSIYLQGALLMSEDSLPSKLSGLRAYLRALEDVSQQVGVTRDVVALNFVAASAPNADLIVGVNSSTQLGELLASSRESLDVEKIPHFFSGIDRSLTDPRLWVT